MKNYEEEENQGSEPRKESAGGEKRNFLPLAKPKFTFNLFEILPIVMFISYPMRYQREQEDQTSFKSGSSTATQKNLVLNKREVQLFLLLLSMIFFLIN